MFNAEQFIKYYPLALAFSFIPWLAFQTQTSMQADAIWLSYSAEQFMAGKSMSEYYFDNNPPMSFLVFIPVILLKSLGLTLWHAHLIYTLALALISIFLCAHFLKRLDLDPLFRTIVLAAYGIGSLIIMSSEFGQKDHFIALALIPFVLAQLALDSPQSKNQRLLCFATLVFFTPFILIKPHYGIIPFVVIAYRLYESRTLKSILKADVAILASGLISYAALLYVVFPDFIDIILPLSLNLYVTSTSAAFNPAVSVGAIAFLIFMIIFTVFAEKATSDEKKLCVLFCLIGALSVIPYWVQEKGFTLHFLPVALCMTLAVISIIWLYIRTASPHFVKSSLIGFLALICCLGVICKPDTERTHDYFIDSFLLRDLGIESNHNAFLIESNSTDISQTLAAYNNLKHATRFSSNWFTLGEAWDLPEAERKNIFDQLGNYIAQDLDRYKPEVIVLIDDERFPSYLMAFKNHEEFQKEMNIYTLASNYETDKILNYIIKEHHEILGKVRYAVYKRNLSDAS